MPCFSGRGAIVELQSWLAYERIRAFDMLERTVPCGKIHWTSMVILNPVIAIEKTGLYTSVLRVVATAYETYSFKIFHNQIVQYFAQIIYFMPNKCIYNIII